MESAHSILLVEDDPFDVRLIRRAFDRAQVQVPVQVVGDGEAAIDYLTGAGAYTDRRAHPLPSLLLLDLKLPRMSGLEVLEWLRTQDALRRLPVIILTSSREQLDVNRAYDLGTNSYLVKPVEAADLQHLIATMGLYWLRLNEGPELPYA